MNSLRIIVLLLLVVTARAGDFEEANQLFDQGKFGEAKRVYERVADRGEWSANLFYNLGNAEFRGDSAGRAALNFERALALDGTHAEARANLKWLREQNGARVPERRWWEYAFPAFGGDAFAIVAVLGGWGVIFLAAAALFGRRAWGWATFALLLAAYGCAGVWLRERDEALAIITEKEAVARLAPADRASVAESLPAGSRVRVLSERGEWIYCALPGGGLGWIPEQQVERVRLKKS